MRNVSVFAVHTFVVTPQNATIARKRGQGLAHDCELQLRILNRTSSGGHKFKGTLRDIGLEVAKAPVWRRIIDASRLSLLCEASLAVKGPWMATTCRAGMKEPVEKTSWSCAELLEFAP